MNESNPQRGHRHMGTRQAVETAIGLSKQDKSSPWGALVGGRISPWAAYGERLNPHQPEDEIGHRGRTEDDAETSNRASSRGAASR